MMRTQILLPDSLYRGLKHLAEVQETSLADVIRRAGERELAAHPEIDKSERLWSPPVPQPLGIRKEISVEDWRLLANEADLAEITRR